MECFYDLNEREHMIEVEVSIVVFGGRDKDPARAKDFKDVKFIY